MLKLAAALLKALTEAEHTAVLTLGKIFKIRLYPRKSFMVFVERSVAINLKSSALELISGRFPEVFTGFPPKVIVAINFVFKFIIKVGI